MTVVHNFLLFADLNDFPFAIPRCSSLTNRNKSVESKGITQSCLHFAPTYVDTTWIQNVKFSRPFFLLKYILPPPKKGHNDTETQGVTDEERKRYSGFSRKGGARNGTI